jgi:hypothetical protein
MWTFEGEVRCAWQAQCVSRLYTAGIWSLWWQLILTSQDSCGLQGPWSHDDVLGRHGQGGRRSAREIGLFVSFSIQDDVLVRLPRDAIAMEWLVWKLRMGRQIEDGQQTDRQNGNVYNLTTITEMQIDTQTDMHTDVLENPYSASQGLRRLARL